VDCCSYVEIPVPDKSAPNGTKFIIGRTDEFGNILNLIRYRMAVHPRSMKPTRFGHVTAEAQFREFGPVWLAFDGMNEAGLTLGAQTLRGSEYEHPRMIHQSDVLAQNLVKKVLENCATVDDTIKWLESHRIVGPSGGAGLHWAVTDATGRSIVVEYLRGKRVVWENTPRVMTNDPPLDWHWRNLDLYVNLNPEDPHQNDFLGVETAVGIVPKIVGHGANLMGIPGDSTPASRYVQLFYLRGYALKNSPPRSVDDAIVLGTALLNRVFIPLGTAAVDQKMVGHKLQNPESTSVGLIKIPSERRILFRGYRNLQWRQIDLKKLTFEEDFEWLVEDGSIGVQDVTPSRTGTQEHMNI